MSTTDVAMGDAIQLTMRNRGPSMVALLPSSVAAYVWPGASGVWVKSTMSRAAMVAVVNTLCAFLWMFVVGVVATAWVVRTEHPAANWHMGDQWRWETFISSAEIVRAQWSGQWRFVGVMDRVSLIGMVGLGVVLAYTVVFFMLLPFAARPGSNKACMRHVLRTVLLGSGLVHWWGVVYAVVFFVYLSRNVPSVLTNYAAAVWPLLMFFAGLVVWHISVMILAVRREYRRVGDYPVAHDPWCDACGYNLTGINNKGRCPECGKAIEESLGEHLRPATAWEMHPSIWNIGVILRQLRMLITQPVKLFYAIPTMTGQREAQRWLLWSLAGLFLTATPIVPAMYVVLEADWNLAVVGGTLAMSVVWTAFGLMMVGIETAGISTFSRMRGHPGGGVYLAAAAKVTSYSCILMMLWVILGGVQLVAYTYFTTKPHDIAQIFHISFRWMQVILGGSLAVSHIGGLLWYELTVYRGVKGIQYAVR